MTTTTAGAPATLFHPNIPLALIVESAINPRKRFDQASLEELAETIRRIGITTPVTVREIETPAGTRFELASGHRRCRAARLAGLTEVPALIRELDDQQFVEVMHLENLQRSDIEPLDEALAYEQLLAEGYDVPSLAVKLGKSPTYVASRVRLLALGEAGREAMARGFLKLSHALELAKLPVATQNEVLEGRWNLDTEALEKAARGESFDEPAAAEGDVWDEEEDEDDGGFPSVDPDVVFRRTPWKPIGEPTLAELRHHLKVDVYRRLSTVPWALDDAELVLAAGACSTCQKRSGCAPLLFAELDAGADACLDQTCFEAKEHAHWERERSERNAEQATAQAEAPTPDAGDDWRAREQRERQQHKEQAKRQAAEIAKRQAGRNAAVRAVLDAVGPTAIVDHDWMTALLFTLVEDVSWTTIDRVVAELQLDPAQSSAADGSMRDLVLAWAQEDGRTLTDIARAVVRLLIGADAVITDAQPRVPVRLERFASLLGVDTDAAAADAMKQYAQETKKATRARRGAAKAVA